MYDVADSMIVSEEGETSYSVILTPEGIDRIILHHSGVNEEFCLKHIELKKIKDRTWSQSLFQQTIPRLPDI